MNKLEILRKKKLSVLRDMAKSEGLDVSVRWNRRTLARKILENRKIKELDRDLDDYVDPASSSGAVAQEKKPEFEALAGGVSAADSALKEPAVTSKPEHIKDEGRGGYREGAGRPKGMTDEEARLRRLLELQVPDLLVLRIIGAMCFFYGTKSGSPLEKEEVQSVAMGATRELYYWFPALQGRTSKLSLHTKSVEEMSAPFVTRVMASYFGEKSGKDEPLAKIIERLSDMKPEQLVQVQSMLGIDDSDSDDEKKAVR